ncbi:hypothetical protein BS50DRAFT_89044 [Corynespora cassiicola Philippines]|uniref:Uncharacterized protein n=1 Tax=Corynespora cassiicola Philippines TaxID=1448308 RepID=A0A2T2NED7_CORCC|nr:hypothetical protein BS50DRAFT_89044 [Corynespora cassiicola Philippines]
MLTRTFNTRAWVGLAGMFGSCLGMALIEEPSHHPKTLPVRLLPVLKKPQSLIRDFPLGSALRFRLGMREITRVKQGQPRTWEHRSGIVR